MLLMAWEKRLYDGLQPSNREQKVGRLVMSPTSLSVNDKSWSSVDVPRCDKFTAQRDEKKHSPLSHENTWNPPPIKLLCSPLLRGVCYFCIVLERKSFA